MLGTSSLRDGGPCRAKKPSLFLPSGLEQAL
jgi:hypothetical protein